MEPSDDKTFSSAALRNYGEAIGAMFNELLKAGMKRREAMDVILETIQANAEAAANRATTQEPEE